MKLETSRITWKIKFEQFSMNCFNGIVGVGKIIRVGNPKVEKFDFGKSNVKLESSSLSCKIS